MRWFRREMTGILAALGLVIGGQVFAGAQESPPFLLERMQVEGLENVFRVRPDLYSGGQPTEAGFAELAKLGVKTVISVDGAAPELDLAHKYGMRYVHLPIGYDSVPVEQQRKLVKARLTFPGPVYIHCHHGKHRGPAAVMSLCRATDPTLTAARAADSLKVMGTAARYAGLYASVAAARPPTDEALRKLSAEFPEKVAVSAMAEQMGAIDGAWDRLKAAAKEGAAQGADRRALLASVVELEELVTEAGRLVEGDAPGLKPAFTTATTQIRRERESLEKPNAAISREEVNQLAARLEQSCNQCHAVHRDRK